MTLCTFIDTQADSVSCSKWCASRLLRILQFDTRNKSLRQRSRTWPFKYWKLSHSKYSLKTGFYWILVLKCNFLALLVHFLWDNASKRYFIKLESEKLAESIFYQNQRLSFGLSLDRIWLQSLFLWYIFDRTYKLPLVS